MAVSVLTSVKNDPVAGTFTAVLTAASSEGASSVFCGFTPRVIKMTQIGGSPDATAQSGYHESMTAAYAWLIGNTGAFTIPTSNGYTLLTGNEASPATAMTGSPGSSGPGFTVGTGVIANSLVYLLEAYR